MVLGLSLIFWKRNTTFLILFKSPLLVQPTWSGAQNIQTWLCVPPFEVLRSIENWGQYLGRILQKRSTEPAFVGLFKLWPLCPKYLIFKDLSKYLCNKPYVIVSLHPQEEPWHSCRDPWGFLTSDHCGSQHDHLGHDKWCQLGTIKLVTLTSCWDYRNPAFVTYHLTYILLYNPCVRALLFIISFVILLSCSFFNYLVCC